MRTRGFTLVELMVAIVVISIIVLYGFPRIQTLLTKSNLRGARTALSGAVQQAKTYAINNGRATTVNLAANGDMWVTATPRKDLTAGVDTIGMVKNLTTVYGAAVNPAQQIVFDQRGLMTPVGVTPQTTRFSKSGYSDSLRINGFGGIIR
jgi:prepilin-type N-terminal cleavage/methylation domain-containing protein